MAAVVSTPVIAYAAALMASQSLNQSTDITATAVFENAYAFSIPVKVGYVTASADALIQCYRSNDNGTTYDTVPTRVFTVPRPVGTGVTGAGAATGVQRLMIDLPGGIWAIRLTTSGPSTATVAMDTARVNTAQQSQ